MCVLGEANEVAHSAELDYRIRVFVPYRYPLYVSLICPQVGGDGGPATTKLEYVSLICIPYMYPLYVSLICLQVGGDAGPRPNARRTI